MNNFVKSVGGPAVYWYGDPEVYRAQIYRLSEGSYQEPLLNGVGELLESPLVPGFSMPIDKALGFEPESSSDPQEGPS